MTKANEKSGHFQTAFNFPASFQFLAFFMTARAALAAISAGLTTIFAVSAADKSDFRHIHITGSLFRFGFLLFHRAGILILAAVATARAAH